MSQPPDLGGQNAGSGQVPSPGDSLVPNLREMPAPGDSLAYDFSHRWQPTPLPDFPEGPSVIDSIKSVADSVAEVLTGPGPSATAAAADMEKAAVDHVVHHPFETLHELEVLGKLVAARTPGGGGISALGVLEGASEIAAAMAAAKVADLAFEPDLERPTTAEAKDAGHLVDGMYFSKDGGQTWWLLRWMHTSALGIPGALMYLVAMIIAALSLLFTTFASSCDGPHVAVQPDDTMRVPTLPPYVLNPGAGPHVVGVDSNTSSAKAHVPTASSSGAPADSALNDAGWEARLQRQRLEAISQGDTDSYNRLIQEHREVYSQHDVDPCTSGFFPQGC